MNESLIQRLQALADATRTRLLLVLDRHELTVSELCSVLQLPQSTVSRHLKILGDEKWLVSRAEGTSRYYRMASPLDAGAKRLWEVVREEVSGGAEAGHDAARAESVVARRRTRSEQFFATEAGRWDAVRAELFGERPDLGALPALLDPEWVVGDLGCGTGRLAEVLAPYVGGVVAVDRSEAMLAAARERLKGVSGVELRRGELEALPVAARVLDAAVVFLVLHYVAEPRRALKEAARVLRPGGRLLVVDMARHEREEYREQMGHVWLGFEETELRAWLDDVGFEAVRWHLLAPDPAAKGPPLFAVSARRWGQGRRPSERGGGGSRG